jgi:phytoene synthase
MATTTAVSTSLANSFAFCERVTRRAAGNFYPAFRLLPRAQCRAMCALYTFLRIADDIADGQGTAAHKSSSLTAWRGALHRALAGNYSHRSHPALHHTVRSYQIPLEYLLAALDGIRMDLAPFTYETFDDLYRYCYRVASAVGLACLYIWGFEEETAKVYAEKAGIAFQLTNILRDLAEDAAHQRIYLPGEDLERFGYTKEQLERGVRNEHFRSLMRFEIDRARSYYDAAEPLEPLLQPHCRAVFLMMMRTYRGLLDVIEERDYDVFSSRIHLSRWSKMGILLRTVPVRWGLA